MEFAGTARSKLLVFALLLLVVVAIVNLMHNVVSFQPSEEAETVTFPAQRRPLMIPLEPATSLAISVVLSLAAGTIMLVAYLKYRPKGGRFPYEELLPILIFVLLLLAFALFLGPQQIPSQSEEDPGDGTTPGQEEGGPGTEVTTDGIPLIRRLGPRVLGLLLVFFAISSAFMLMTVLRGRRVSSLAELIESESRQEVARSIETGIYRLQLGDDIRSVILGCYRDLIDLLRGRGMKAEPQLTAREVEIVALDRLGLSPRGAQSLRVLFEVARYSSHPLTEAHRKEAIRSLEGVRKELGG